MALVWTWTIHEYPIVYSMVVINGIFYGISMDIDEKLMGSIQQLSHQFTNYMVNVQSHMECGPPAHEIAKLANITPISRWLQ